MYVHFAKLCIQDLLGIHSTVFSENATYIARYTVLAGKIFICVLLAIMIRSASNSYKLSGILQLIINKSAYMYKHDVLVPGHLYKKLEAALKSVRFLKL